MEFRKHGTAVTINLPTRAALEAAISARLAAREGFALATLNLDHLVKLRRDAAFRRAYAAQDYVCADGNPVVWLSRLAGREVELLPGADLVVPLARMAAQAGVPVALLGSRDTVLERAAASLRAQVPDLEVAFAEAPPMGFDPDGPAAEALLQRLAQSGAGLCFLALGAPKQERLAARGRQLAPAVGFASIGASLDFLAGAQRRAPRLARALALEWLWRALTQPRRLLPRYAACAAILPAEAAAALGQRRAARSPAGQGR